MQHQQPDSSYAHSVADSSGGRHPTNAAPPYAPPYAERDCATTSKPDRAAVANRCANSNHAAAVANRCATNRYARSGGWPFDS